MFFVLSGMVIAFVVSNKEKDARTYATARVSRIVPVAILALIVTFACDRIGQAIDPAFYRDLGFFHGNGLPELLSYLTFTNQLWLSHIVFGTNEPYWSLGFEVWYYALFGLACFAPARGRLPLLALWAMVVGPKILMYLPLWLLGVAVYRIQRHPRFAMPTVAAAAIFLLTLPLYIYMRRHFGPLASTMYHSFGFGQEVVNLFYFHAIGLLVSANILAFAALFARLPPPPEVLGRAIRWTAGASFTLYLIHLPLLVMLRVAFPSAVSSPAGTIAVGALALGATFALAEVAERRKHLYQPAARRMIDAIADVVAPASPRRQG